MQCQWDNQWEEYQDNKELEMDTERLHHLEDELIKSCNLFDLTKSWDGWTLTRQEFDELYFHYRDSGTMPTDPKIARIIELMIVLNKLTGRH